MDNTLQCTPSRRKRRSQRVGQVRSTTRSCSCLRLPLWKQNIYGRWDEMDEKGRKRHRGSFQGSMQRWWYTLDGSSFFFEQTRCASMTTSIASDFFMAKMKRWTGEKNRSPRQGRCSSGSARGRYSVASWWCGANDQRRTACAHTTALFRCREMALRILTTKGSSIDMPWCLRWCSLLERCRHRWFHKSRGAWIG